MGHSHTNLLYHVVFSTKDRQPWLGTEIGLRLYGYLGGAIRSEAELALASMGARIISTCLQDSAKIKQCPMWYAQSKQAGTLRKMVIVTPSASRSFYMDYEDGSQKWESFIIGPFLEHLRQTQAPPYCHTDHDTLDKISRAGLEASVDFHMRLLEVTGALAR